MSEEQQNVQQADRPPALEREERRLQRLRVVSQLPTRAELLDDDEDDPGPEAA